MKRSADWRQAGFTVTVRGGDGRMMSLDECAKPSLDALYDLYKIRDERQEQRESYYEMTMPHVVFDSCWYCPIPGRPLPPIEAFEIPAGQRAGNVVGG
jgi:hypothetical protein